MTEEDIKIIEDVCESIPSTCLNGSGEVCPSCIKVRKARALIARLREENRKAGVIVGTGCSKINPRCCCGEIHGESKAEVPAPSPSPDTRRVWDNSEPAPRLLVIQGGDAHWMKFVFEDGRINKWVRNEGEFNPSTFPQLAFKEITGTPEAAEALASLDRQNGRVE